MPVGLVTQATGGIPTVIIAANTQNVDVAVQLGNPTGKVVYRLVVSSGVVVGSSDPANPSIDATGLTADSEGTWVLDGSVYGAGAGGGNGSVNDIDTGPNSGGGGGAGSIVGPGGLGGKSILGDADDGDPGTLTTGGIGGVATFTYLGAPPQAWSAGADGGDAIQLNHAIDISINDVLAGAGGGGSGGWTNASAESIGGAAGGDLGDPGEENPINFIPHSPPGSGAAGFAIRYSESGDATILAGSAIGTVG